MDLCRPSLTLRVTMNSPPSVKPDKSTVTLLWDDALVCAFTASLHRLLFHVRRLLDLPRKYRKPLTGRDSRAIVSGQPFRGAHCYPVLMRLQELGLFRIAKTERVTVNSLRRLVLCKICFGFVWRFLSPLSSTSCVTGRLPPLPIRSALFALIDTTGTIIKPLHRLSQIHQQPPRRPLRGRRVD